MRSCVQCFSGFKALKQKAMIKEQGEMYWIACDKCGADDFCMKANQASLAKAGWSMNSRAKKLVHLCPTCEASRKRRS